MEFALNNFNSLWCEDFYFQCSLQEFLKKHLSITRHKKKSIKIFKAKHSQTFCWRSPSCLFDSHLLSVCCVQVLSRVWRFHMEQEMLFLGHGVHVVAEETTFSKELQSQGTTLSPNTLTQPGILNREVINTGSPEGSARITERSDLIWEPEGLPRRSRVSAKYPDRSQTRARPPSSFPHVDHLGLFCPTWRKVTSTWCIYWTRFLKLR